MSDHTLRFGDVIEWDIASSDRDVARWLILRPSKYGYVAVWLGGDLREFGKIEVIGMPDSAEAGRDYRLVEP